MSNPYSAPATVQKPTSVGVSRVKLKRVGVLSVAIFTSVAGAIGGLLVGIIVFVLSLLGLAFGGGGGNAFAGILGVVLFPLLYGVAGLIGGLLQACIYNIVAGLTGGIEMEFSDRPA